MQCFVFHLYKTHQGCFHSQHPGFTRMSSKATPPRFFLENTFWELITYSFLSYEEAVPTRMILNSVLMLLLRIASRQAVITWFFGFPTRRRPAR